MVNQQPEAGQRNKRGAEKLLTKSCDNDVDYRSTARLLFGDWPLHCSTGLLAVGRTPIGFISSQISVACH